MPISYPRFGNSVIRGLLIMIPRASPGDVYKSCSQFLHSIVDASRLDLSSPSMVIYPLGLMNRPGDSQTGFDESNPYIEFTLQRMFIFVVDQNVTRIKLINPKFEYRNSKQYQN
jgi:hypothetical protein